MDIQLTLICYFRVCRFCSVLGILCLLTGVMYLAGSFDVSHANVLAFSNYFCISNVVIECDSVALRLFD
jgi:hypothetical protein